jgi:hypothetical protein
MELEFFWSTKTPIDEPRMRWTAEDNTVSIFTIHPPPRR